MSRSSARRYPPLIRRPGTRWQAGGGAPPVHQYAEQYDKRVINVKVIDVYFEDLKKEDKKLKVLIKNIRLNGF